MNICVSSAQVARWVRLVESSSSHLGLYLPTKTETYPVPAPISTETVRDLNDWGLKESYM